MTLAMTNCELTLQAKKGGARRGRQQDKFAIVCFFTHAGHRVTISP